MIRSSARVVLVPLHGLVVGLLVAGTAAPAFAQAKPTKALPPPTPDDLAKAADAAADVANVSASGDDLAKAADAAAAAASVTPDNPAAPAATKPSADDIDLSALGLDPTGAAPFDDKLNLYGFADTSYYTSHWNKTSPVVPNNSKTFISGDLDLYMAKNLTPRARTLAEVRFSYIPNGTVNANGTVVDTTAQDASQLNRVVQWGGVVIERAYVEYDLSDHFTIRAGHWLTPYGLWNIDHGSPTIISAVRPYVIGQALFPEHQTGLDLLGSYGEAGFRLAYHLTVSNGRGTTESVNDSDSRFGFGGRLELETPWGLKLGGSYYRGRFSGVVETFGVPPDTYLEASYGGDLSFDHGPLHVQSELIVHERHYADSFRTVGAAGFIPDGRDVGFYAIAGYRLDVLWNVMPFVYAEEFSPADQPYYNRYDNECVGLNFRPAPVLVFKAMGCVVNFPKGNGLLAGNTVEDAYFQAAWMF